LDETPAEENVLPTGAREITLRFLAAPTDAGYSGNVGGGRVLQWIDQAGYACAVGWSGRYCVTAYVGNVKFSRPVGVGHLVEVAARLVHIPVDFWRAALGWLAFSIVSAALSQVAIHE